MCVCYACMCVCVLKWKAMPLEALDIGYTKGPIHEGFLTDRDVRTALKMTKNMSQEIMGV